MDKKLNNLNYIRTKTYQRNDKIFREVFNEKTLSKKLLSFEINPYSKIKTILNIELSCILIYLLLKTKLSANFITILGILDTYWSYFIILV